MSPISRRSLFGSLAAVPVAMAAKVVPFGRTTQRVTGHLTFSVGPIQKMLEEASTRIEWRFDHLNRFAHLFEDAEPETIFVDGVKVYDARDARAIDSMINEGGRDWV